MKVKIKIVIACFSILLLVNARAQENYETEQVIPPSPTAASLGAYGDIPVNYFTGRPNISIPLHQVKTSQHQLDISMSYNSSIRVNEDASWVGLGWALQAGGVITRTIRGLDDFIQDDGDVYATPGTGYYYSPSILAPDYTPEDDPIDGIYKTVNTSDEAAISDPVAIYFKDASEGRIDLEPDIFYYNFAGYSGSFVLGKQAEGSVVYQNSQDDLKIEINFNTPNDEYGEWKITTPEGYTYSFATAELSENVSTDNINLWESELEGLGPNVGYYENHYDKGPYAFRRTLNWHANAWYLDYIEAPNGERITFDYIKWGKTLSNINISQQRYDMLGSQTIAPNDYEEDENGNIICEDITEGYSNTYSFTNASRQITDNIVLESIDFTNGEIKFLTEDRKDIEKFEGGNGAQKLSEIEVYSGGDLIKTIYFNHDYFNSSFQNSTDNMRYTRCRLKLESVTEQGKAPWTFEYYDPDLLPSKYTKQVDKWGFYNPTITIESIEGFFHHSTGSLVSTWIPEVNYGGTTYEGTVRDPDESGLFSRRGLIKKITYPTGGWTRFEFEPNQIQLATPVVTEVFDVLGYVENEGNLDESEDKYEWSFSTGAGDKTLKFWAYPTYAEEPVSSTQGLAWLKTNSDVILETFYLTDLERTIDERVTTLSSGSYKLVVDPLADHFVQLVIGNIETESTDKKIVGGLRIAEMTNHDFNGKKVATRKYLYTLDGTQDGAGSGSLLDDPKKYEIRDQTKYYFKQCNQPLDGPYWTFEAGASFLYRTSNTLYPMGFNSPSGVVVYPKVYELLDESGKSGMTSYEFRSPAFNTYNVEPVPNTLNLGDVDDTKLYNSNGGLEYEIDNSFEIKDLKYLFGIRIDKLKSLYDPCPACFLVDPPAGVQIPYYLNWSEWFVVDEVTKTEYTTNGNIIEVESFNYNSPDHKLITSSSMTDSEEITETITYKYPHDFSGSSPYNNMITNHHIISPVVEKTISKGGIQLELRKVNYSDWGGGVFKPITIQSRFKNEPMETRVRFGGYDSNGNPLEVQKEHDSKTSYIWGYDGLYPVIKAQNVGITELENAVDLTLIQQGYTGLADLDIFLGDIGYLSTSLERIDWWNFNEDLRDRFSGDDVLISTYTYIPHVGMSSMTDPARVPTYYEYDNASRLSAIRNMDYDILESYKYEYKD